MAARTIMIQGTASNVGKSLLVAGLCRIFKQDGYRVAPFKSQNMALNSFITRDGLEMGRAQVVQAEAAGIEPAIDMNPILLKPTGDSKSQIIVQGEIFGNMNAAAYYSYKKTFTPRVKESFDRLSAAYDIIVLEGAGSPAEINLKENDIVNMYMAALAGAPVILAGDIDRGGVFAALAGTMQLFSPEERDMVKGVLINKFRGDIAILRPGLRQLEDIIHKPVLGVIPYLKIDIDDEDSLSERFYAKTEGALADIAVIRLPHISNFTDFNALARIPGAGLRYVDYRGTPEGADLIIIPGTKNTMSDLLWLKQNGIGKKIRKAAAGGTPVIGICGGYQMLGKYLKDPGGAESGGEMEGLGLLPVVTVFEKAKTRNRVQGTFASVTGLLKPLSGMEIEGYEVHMGKTSGETADALPALLHTRDTITGTCKQDGCFLGNIYGAYVHGLFDAGNIALNLVKSLCAAKGIAYETPDTFPEANYKTYKEQQYDILADSLRSNIDMEKIYAILEEGL
ncbi:MAG: cobyric acid synthase [Treponema sp.]|jgi:adenosylcobyric acid synthase|nr:cobyric acid synthase [Treponema sp.]